MYVYMYVCMFVCMYVCMYVCLFVCMNVYVCESKTPFFSGWVSLISYFSIDRTLGTGYDIHVL